MVRYIAHASSIARTMPNHGFVEAICAYFVSSSCPIPAPAPLNLTTWFTKPKPSGRTAPVSPPNGQRLKVLHLSDFHIDPRKFNGNTRAYPMLSM